MLLGVLLGRGKEFGLVVLQQSCDVRFEGIIRTRVIELLLNYRKHRRQGYGRLPIISQHRNTNGTLVIDSGVVNPRRKRHRRCLERVIRGERQYEVKGAILVGRI